MSFQNKMLTREAAAERYGHIDLASRVWPDQPKWVTMFQVPKNYFPNLTIQDTGIKCMRIACNRDLIRPLTDAFNRLCFFKLDQYLLTYDGCLNIRSVRGRPDLISAHAWGLAVDFNAATNRLGTAGDMRDDVAGCFTEMGWDWGKSFQRQDPQHFSYCWE